MPELPEVETVARDLRPLITARDDHRHPLRLAAHGPRRGRRGVRGRGRSAGTIEGTGRRAKLLLIELSGDFVIAVHLKMTGQLFVVPADAPQDRFVHLVFELDDGRELRFRDIRKFGRVGRLSAGGDRGRRRPRGRSARATSSSWGPNRSIPTFTLNAVPRPHRRPPGPAEDAPDRPDLPRRDRQHLRRRGALAGPTPSAAVGGLAAARRRAPALRGDPDRARGGGRVPRLVDRRLHGARRRRLDAGAPAGLPARRRGLPALRATPPPDRPRHALHAFLLVVPAAPGGGPESRRRRSSRRIGRRSTPGRRWTELDGAGSRRADAGRGDGRGRPAGPDRADAPGGGDSARHGAIRRGARAQSRQPGADDGAS